MALSLSIDDLLSGKVDPVFSQRSPLTALGHNLVYSQVGEAATHPTTPPLTVKSSPVPLERGAGNIPLSAMGEAQIHIAARQIADTLRKHGDSKMRVQIYTSYWDRARRTADIIQNELRQFNPLVKYVDNLAPQSLGGLESRPTSDVKSVLDQLRTTKSNVVPPGQSPLSGLPGETTDSYKQRILPTIDKIMQESSQNPALLNIVSAHSSDMRLCRSWVSAGYKTSLTLDPRYMRTTIPGFQVDGLMSSGGKWFYRTNVLHRVQDMRVVLFRHGDTPFQGKDK